MPTVQRSNTVSNEVKAPRQQNASLTMFTLKAGAVKSLAGKNWPADAEFAIVSSTPETASQIREVVGNKLARVSEVLAAGQGTARPATRDVVRNKAFEPDARSRALLRGIKIAEDDLMNAGGAFDLEQVRTLMRGVSRQAVDKRVQEGSLLAVPGPSNRRRYPTLQFDADGSIVAGLQQVQEALPTKNPWMVLNFLAQPDARLEGRKPIDLLRAGGVDVVVEAASRYVEQGA